MGNTYKVKKKGLFTIDLMWVTLITKKKCGLHLKNAFFKLVVNNLLFGIGVLHSYVVLCKQMPRHGH